jgi:hypothetical protein
MVVVSQSGEPIYLSLQLSDGDESLPKKVFAKLRDESKATIATLELTHIGDGLFVKDDFEFPVNTDYLTAQYFVYENDGITKDDQYLISYDYFPLTLDGGGSGPSSNLQSDEEIELFIDDEPEELDIEVD